jgi:hypothetical protein
MRKIPTLFVRHIDFENSHITEAITPGCEWVAEGLGVATAKWDGVATMLDAYGNWWARREVREGRPFPPVYLTVQRDPNTGKTVGWEPIEQSGYRKAFGDACGDSERRPGTFELIGPKVNGNPHGVGAHHLIRHGTTEIPGAPRSFDTLRAYLRSKPSVPDGLTAIEGIVFWSEPGNLDAPMAKIKVRDFR